MYPQQCTSRYHHPETHARRKAVLDAPNTHPPTLSPGSWGDCLCSVKDMSSDGPNQAGDSLPVLPLPSSCLSGTQSPKYRHSLGTTQRPQQTQGHLAKGLTPVQQDGEASQQTSSPAGPASDAASVKILALTRMGPWANYPMSVPAKWGS